MYLVLWLVTLFPVPVMLLHHWVFYVVYPTICLFVIAMTLLRSLSAVAILTWNIFQLNLQMMLIYRNVRITSDVSSILVETSVSWALQIAHLSAADPRSLLTLRRFIAPWCLLILNDHFLIYFCVKRKIFHVFSHFGYLIQRIALVSSWIRFNLMINMLIEEPRRHLNTGSLHGGVLPMLTLIENLEFKLVIFLNLVLSLFRNQVVYAWFLVVGLLLSIHFLIQLIKISQFENLNQLIK